MTPRPPIWGFTTFLFIYYYYFLFVFVENFSSEFELWEPCVIKKESGCCFGLWLKEKIEDKIRNLIQQLQANKVEKLFRLYLKFVLLPLSLLNLQILAIFLLTCNSLKSNYGNLLLLLPPSPWPYYSLRPLLSLFLFFCFFCHFLSLSLKTHFHGRLNYFSLLQLPTNFNDKWENL